MDDDRIVLDRKTFETLAIDTRVNILKELRERRKTQAEIAKRMGLATSTVYEHLQKMADTGLIERKEDGHKWVYYSLTEKGRAIVAPSRTPIFVLALTVAAFMIVFGSFGFLSVSAPMKASAPTLAQAPEAYDTAGAPLLAAGATANGLNTTEQSVMAESAPASSGSNAYSSMALIIAGIGIVAAAVYWKKQ